jgi:hypothetical protein
MKYVNVPCIILGLFVLISHQSVVFFSLNKSTTHQHYFSAPAKPTGRLSLAHFFFCAGNVAVSDLTRERMVDASCIDLAGI